MYDTEDDRDRIKVTLVWIRSARDPVQDVEGAIRAKADKVVGIDDGWDGGLAKEKKLW